MIKFIITHFDGDGYPSKWFDSLEEVNQFIEKENIDMMDVTDIIEVEVKRVIRYFDREKEIDRLIEEHAKKTGLM